MKSSVHGTPKKCITIYLLLTLLPLTTNIYAATVYNDVDFSSPTHTAGGEPTFSGAIDTPSRSVFGGTQVVPSLGPIDNQALLLNTTGSTDWRFFYDQIKFDLGYMQDTYHLSFDVYTEDLIGSPNQFVVFLDLPSVSGFSLLNDGTIDAGYPSTSATYEDRTLFHVDISFDIPNNRKVVLIDNQIIADGSEWRAPEDLESVRFSLGTKSATSSRDDSTNVVIDNILITNSFVVPEPASIGLIGLCASGIFFTRRIFMV